MREKITFLTPLIFLARFLLSFICFLDFSTFVANPFCEQPTQTTSKQEYLMNITRGTIAVRVTLSTWILLAGADRREKK
jgi:hypothetical protein